MHINFRYIIFKNIQFHQAWRINVNRHAWHSTAVPIQYNTRSFSLCESEFSISSSLSDFPMDRSLRYCKQISFRKNRYSQWSNVKSEGSYWRLNRSISEWMDRSSNRGNGSLSRRRQASLWTRGHIYNHGSSAYRSFSKLHWQKMQRGTQSISF